MIRKTEAGYLIRWVIICEVVSREDAGYWGEVPFSYIDKGFQIFMIKIIINPLQAKEKLSPWSEMPRF